MPCEHYQNALIEAAASGVEPQGELRAHLANCATCRTAFSLEQSLFSSMDEGLRAAANPEVPASLLPRVRARLADEPAPIRSWRFRFVVAGAVAIVVAFLVARTAWHTSVEQPSPNTSSDSTTSSMVRPGRQAQNPDAATALAGNSVAHPQDAATRASGHPVSRPTGDSIPEVLVSPDQEVLLASYAEEWNRRKRLPLVATNLDATNLPLLQIAPIQIAQLDVKLMAEEQAQ
jgi:hypothetical protein